MSEFLPRVYSLFLNPCLLPPPLPNRHHLLLFWWQIFSIVMTLWNVKECFYRVLNDCMLNTEAHKHAVTKWEQQTYLLGMVYYSVVIWSVQPRFTQRKWMENTAFGELQTNVLWKNEFFCRLTRLKVNSHLKVSLELGSERSYFLWPVDQWPLFCRRFPVACTSQR